MSLSSIASKLRALQALAESPGATEHERLRAAEKYEELLAKYHLDASELELREEGTDHCEVTFGTRGNGFATATRLASAVGKFTDCKCWLSHGGGSVHFLGLKSDTQFAEWLTRSLVQFIQLEAMDWSWNAEPGDIYRGDVEAFVLAAAVRVSARMKALKSGPTSGALVVTRAKMINEAFAALGIRLSASRVTVVTGRDFAMKAGAQAGDKAGFARPTSYTATLRLGKE